MSVAQYGNADNYKKISDSKISIVDYCIDNLKNVINS